MLNEPGELTSQPSQNVKPAVKKANDLKATPLKPPGKKMPFAFNKSILLFQELSSIFQSKTENWNGAMLHESIIYCRHRVVNPTPDCPCRAAAQFNNSLQPTPVGRLSSAFAVDITAPAWLSSGR